MLRTPDTERKQSSTNQQSLLWGRMIMIVLTGERLLKKVKTLARVSLKRKSRQCWVGYTRYGKGKQTDTETRS